MHFRLIRRPRMVRKHSRRMSQQLFCKIFLRFCSTEKIRFCSHSLHIQSKHLESINQSVKELRNLISIKRERERSLLWGSAESEWQRSCLGSQAISWRRCLMMMLYYRGDIYIMMKCLSVCLSVTKNHHFLLWVSCNHLNPPLTPCPTPG